MENKFSPKMEAKTTEDLIHKVENKKDYTEEAILACLWELKKRNNLSPSNIDLLRDIEERQYKEIEASIERKDTENKDSKETRKFIFELITFKQKIVAVPAIFYLCLTVYILMLIFGVHAMEPSPYDLLEWGGNLTQLSFGYQPWRLITHIFIHGNIIHILMNMCTLFQIGLITEMLLGKKWFIISFILSGIGGGIASAAFNYNVVSVGASGSIFGLFGLLVGFSLLPRNKEFRKSLRLNLLVFLGYNLLFGLTRDGIDNAAHFGGFVTGIIMGLIIGLFELEKTIISNK